jgi:hypothetical protein
MELIAHALSRAGTSYIEEATNTRDSAAFFENTIDRALMPLLDPSSMSQSLRRSFSYEELEETNLTDLIQNMKLVIAGQREEIECLRMTVMELVLGIADNREVGVAPQQRVPAMIQVEESSPEASVDQDIFRRATRQEKEQEEDDGFSYLLSSIARSRSNLTDDSHHIEPEGTYMPLQTIEKMHGRRKEDPPTNSYSDDTEERKRLVSWDNEDNDLDGGEFNEAREFSDAFAGNEDGYYHDDGRPREVMVGNFGPGQPPTDRAAISVDEDDGTPPPASRPSVASPARERAINIVQERRRRYQNFRRKNGEGMGTSLQSKLSKSSTSFPADDAASRASRATSVSTASRAVSPLVRFREDELTLMETKKTRDPKNDDKQEEHNEFLE